jgi:hypothetical protein
VKSFIVARWSLPIFWIGIFIALVHRVFFKQFIRNGKTLLCLILTVPLLYVDMNDEVQKKETVDLQAPVDCKKFGQERTSSHNAVVRESEGWQAVWSILEIRTK